MWEKISTMAEATYINGFSVITVGGQLHSLGETSIKRALVHQCPTGSFLACQGLLGLFLSSHLLKNRLLLFEFVFVGSDLVLASFLSLAVLLVEHYLVHDGKQASIV